MPTPRTGRTTPRAGRTADASSGGGATPADSRGAADSDAPGTGSGGRAGATRARGPADSDTTGGGTRPRAGAATPAAASAAPTAAATSAATPATPATAATAPLCERGADVGDEHHPHEWRGEQSQHECDDVRSRAADQAGHCDSPGFD